MSRKEGDTETSDASAGWTSARTWSLWLILTLFAHEASEEKLKSQARGSDLLLSISLLCPACKEKCMQSESSRGITPLEADTLDPDAVLVMEEVSLEEAGRV